MKVSAPESHSSHVWVYELNCWSVWLHPECLGYITNLPRSQVVNFCSGCHLGSLHKSRWPDHPWHQLSENFWSETQTFINFLSSASESMCRQGWNNNHILHTKKLVLSFVIYVTLSPKISHDFLFSQVKIYWTFISKCISNHSQIS